MVDLVKIRKKAKKKEEEGSAEGRAAVPAAEPPASPPAPESRPEAGEPGGETPALPQTSKLEKFKESAGKRRDAQMTVEAAAEDGGNRLELLTFVIAGENYAVDIEHIIEIVTPRPVTRIPNADASVVGIVSLRGTIVTLVDVRRKLRHPPLATTDADTRVVVVDLRGETLGFTVDRVLRVIKTTETQIEPHPVVHASEQDIAVRGVFRVGNALTILVDLDKLLDSRALAAPTA